MLLCYVDLTAKSNSLDWEEIGGVWSRSTNEWGKCYD